MKLGTPVTTPEGKGTRRMHRIGDSVGVYEPIPSGDPTCPAMTVFEGTIERMSRRTGCLLCRIRDHWFQAELLERV